MPSSGDDAISWYAALAHSRANWGRTHDHVDPRLNMVAEIPDDLTSLHHAPNNVARASASGSSERTSCAFTAMVSLM